MLFPGTEVGLQNVGQILSPKVSSKEELDQSSRAQREASVPEADSQPHETNMIF